MSDILNAYFGLPSKIVKFRCAFHNTVYDVLLSRGLAETPNEMDWDIHWCEKDWIHDVFDKVHLMSNQRVNHFRNHFQLTRKDNLAKNLKKAKRDAEKEGRADDVARLDVIPQTFLLPTEYPLFVQHFKKEALSPERTTFIMKPIGKSQGKGIFLFDKLSDISEWKGVRPSLSQQSTGSSAAEASNKPPTPTVAPTEAYVVQKYISNPLLIGGRKFDLRLYALVTSYQPLEVWIYRSGFARFAHERYSLERGDLENTTIHLTNVAVQKHSDKYDKDVGGKWDLRRLKIFMQATRGDAAVNALFLGLEDMMVASLQSVSKIMLQDPHCFELYGFDIMIDDKLRPWLLEVNASPSLSANTESDHEIKIGLLDDVLSVLDLEKRGLVGPETHRVGGFDAKVRLGQRVTKPYPTLGSLNDRREQIESLCVQQLRQRPSSAGEE
jgi:tubulin polyglutamylase TTLL9